MKNAVVVVSCLSLASCSSLKRTLVYSSLAGGVTGAISGFALSPNKESQGANAAVFGAIGAGVSALVGYALYEDDPRNYKLKSMMLDPQASKDKDANDIDFNFGPLKIETKLTEGEAYQTPITDLPEKLKGKVSKQFLIKYRSRERYVRKGDKTFYIPPFEVYQHAYGENLEEAKKGADER